ncbi:hypothetical protein [Mycoplasma sp. SG1]|uniref:hypothetical protein n=1 Tax=Mycoplasma sp. SG1 TaxID=2810348 RepID=UPI002024BE19|nr:hypothetical protein [Mycoplasma sp. SG1]URM53180.1 hypothetical protein JRW51_02425 [Mycoplasma sp. SG1]
MGIFSNKAALNKLEEKIIEHNYQLKILKEEISKLEEKLKKLTRIDLLINSNEIQNEVNKIIDYCIETKLLNHDLLKKLPKK